MISGDRFLCSSQDDSRYGKILTSWVWMGWKLLLKNFIKNICLYFDWLKIFLSSSIRKWFCKFSFTKVVQRYNRIISNSN